MSISNNSDRGRKRPPSTPLRTSKKRMKSNVELEDEEGSGEYEDGDDEVFTNIEDTFDPVARLDSVRTLIGPSVEHQLHVYQLDVTTAYLSGRIEEKILMEVPEGVEEGLREISEHSDTRKGIRECARSMLSEIEKGHQVRKHNRAIYGINEAGKQWHDKLDGIVTSHVFSKQYLVIFIKSNKNAVRV